MEKLKSERRGKLGAMLFCVALSAVVMAVCTMCFSLFYPMNTWVDVNCYSTMGRGLLRGKVLYRDLYEQKGPLLYFLYALGMAISPDSYFGVYLIEAICFSAFLYFSGKCAGLYLKHRWTIYAILPPLAAVIVTSRAFALGGSAEELLLFPVIASMYMLLRAVQKKELFPGRDAFWVGVFASASLWIKYTLSGFYIGLALFVLLYYWLGLRQPKRLPGVIGWFVLGLAPITAVMLAYFAANGALDEMFQAYFYNNIFLYSSTDGGNILTMLSNVVRYTYVTLWYNRLYMGLALLGMLWFLAGVRSRLWETIAAYLGYGCLIFFVFVGGAYSTYYGLYFAAFSVFGLIVLVCAGQRLAEKRPVRIPVAAVSILCAAVLICSLSYTYRYGRNGYWRRERQSIPQYKFAEIIREKEGSTLLNYGFLDGGFYYAAGLVPDVEYFCQLNIPLPEMFLEQNRYVREGVTDFVVVNGDSRDRFLKAMRGYHLVAEADDFYYLYQRD